MRNELEFRRNSAKVVEMILWIANKQPEGVDQYCLLKTIFEADRYHLNQYGRPVSGDTYLAMEHGPVPEFAYQLVRGGDSLAVESVGGVPFTKNHWTVVPERSADTNFFSESDIEAMEQAWLKCKGKTFTELHLQTSENAAYKAAWGQRRSGSEIINLADLVEDPQQKEVLKEIASRIRV